MKKRDPFKDDTAALTQEWFSRLVNHAEFPPEPSLAQAWTMTASEIESIRPLESSSKSAHTDRCYASGSRYWMIW